MFREFSSIWEIQVNAPMVRSLLARLGLRSQAGGKVETQRTPQEWTMPELAYRLAMPQPTLHAWLCRGWLKARKDPNSPHGVWLIQVEDSGGQKARRFRKH